MPIAFESCEKRDQFSGGCCSSISLTVIFGNLGQCKICGRLWKRSNQEEGWWSSVFYYCDECCPSRYSVHCKVCEKATRVAYPQLDKENV